MMVRLFIEAGHEKTQEYVFLDTLIQYLGFARKQYEIICVGGKNNLVKAANKFKENTLEGGKNLIVFDADTSATGCGFTTTLQRINQELQGNGMQADGIFLFPNNADDGILENLLELLMQKKTHKQWVDCYSDYEACLGDQYLTPDLKGKLFTYISAQKTLSNTKRSKLGSGQWQFNDTRYWNLNAPELQPLKDFLRNNIS